MQIIIIFIYYMGDYQHLAGKYYSKYRTLSSTLQLGGGKKHQQPKKRTAKEKRRRAKEKQARLDSLKPSYQSIIRPSEPGLASQINNVSIQESDLEYKQDNVDCVIPSGARPMWTDYVSAGASEEASPKCPHKEEYPNHRYLHNIDGRYCCTDRPTSPLEACSFLQDQIEPQFDNFDERFVKKHRDASLQWKPYCDYVLSNPDKYTD
jgi:hypothetical protein